MFQRQNSYLCTLLHYTSLSQWSRHCFWFSLAEARAASCATPCRPLPTNTPAPPLSPSRGPRSASTYWAVFSSACSTPGPHASTCRKRPACCSPQDYAVASRPSPPSAMKGQPCYAKVSTEHSCSTSAAVSC